MATARRATATTRSKAKRPTRTSLSTSKVSQESADARSSFATSSSFSGLQANKKIIIAVLIVLVIVLLGYFKKNWFVAAIVNGKPIANLTLQSRLNSYFREQALQEMITEQIILDEAKKNNIVITKDQIDKKIAEIEASFGGAQALDQYLAAQGQTRAHVRDQIEAQLAADELYKNEATVSAEEVQKFVTQNQAQLKASDSAGQTKEAEDYLKSDKLRQIVSEKLQELKNNAKITIF